MSSEVLFVLHEMGTLDHAAALKTQFEDAGGSVRHVVVGGAQLPAWALAHFPPEKALAEDEALSHVGTFRAVWLAEPYESLRPARWRQLWEKVPLIYSGYGLSLSAWREGYYGLDFYSHCEKILVASNHDIEGHLSAGRNPDDLVLAGDPFLFEIAENSAQKRASQPLGIVLWAPHWAKTWDGGPGFANWEWTVGPLYRFFRERPFQRLIVRPHPHLNFERGSWQARRKARALLALPNVSVSIASMRQDIEDCDILVSDGVGILAYFGVTGKPVVFVRRAKSAPPFNPVGFELVSGAQSATTPSELVTLLSSISDLDPRASGLEINHMRESVLRHFFVEKTSPGAALLASLQPRLKG